MRPAGFTNVVAHRKENNKDRKKSTDALHRRRGATESAARRRRQPRDAPRAAGEPPRRQRADGGGRRPAHRLRDSLFQQRLRRRPGLPPGRAARQAAGRRPPQCGAASCGRPRDAAAHRREHGGAPRRRRPGRRRGPHRRTLRGPHAAPRRHGRPGPQEPCPDRHQARRRAVAEAGEPGRQHRGLARGAQDDLHAPRPRQTARGAHVRDAQVRARGLRRAGRPAPRREPRGVAAGRCGRRGGEHAAPRKARGGR
mmetsp:Transcript_25635/g.83058  ORF Transcript_25635/g.83058 Transcript_25635/m.83058 type:complete len:254 (-) Transcript_25635:972-1733(-)